MAHHKDKARDIQAAIALLKMYVRAPHMRGGHGGEIELTRPPYENLEKEAEKQLKESGF
jgi:hypothetical protein